MAAGESKRVEIDRATLEGVVEIARRGEIVVVAREGQPVAAVLDIEALRHLTDERELLRRLALGELESAAGQGDELESVLEDCRMLLEGN